MLIDTNFGGSLDGSEGADLKSIDAQVREAQEQGFAGAWCAETTHDPFLTSLLGIERSTTMQIGTSIAVAFARNPMTVAMSANDLQSLSGGRFILGLGSQIKPHIERRFNMPWSSPAARMREFIEALRAIWHSFETGDRLNFRGDFYQHTLLTPMFNPGPNPFGQPKVMLAAVGGLMTQAAASVADGILIHGFTTERYLREVTLPTIETGLKEAGKSRDDFAVCYPGFVVTGANEEQLAIAAAAVRKQIAFYGSTPAYQGVLELHGWGALGAELNTLSKRGEWDTMGTLIDDEVLGTFAAVGTPDEAAKQIRERYADLADRFTFYTPYALDTDVRNALLHGLSA